MTRIPLFHFLDANKVLVKTLQTGPLRGSPEASKSFPLYYFEIGEIDYRKINGLNNAKLINEYLNSDRAKFKRINDTSFPEDDSRIKLWISHALEQEVDKQLLKVLQNEGGKEAVVKMIAGQIGSLTGFFLFNTLTPAIAAWSAAHGFVSSEAIMSKVPSISAVGGTVLFTCAIGVVTACQKFRNRFLRNPSLCQDTGIIKADPYLVFPVSPHPNLTADAVARAFEGAFDVVTRDIFALLQLFQTM